MAAPADKTASDELAEYKAERARNWPSRVNVERKSAQLSDMQSRGELDLQADAHKRKLRLQSILEQQRKLGHFEASRECAALVSGGDPHASEARKKQRKQDAPREKEQHIAGGAKHLAGSSADDESRRLREREAALARMRGGAEAPKVVAVEGAEPAKDAAPAAHARGPAAAASHKHARGEQPAPPQVAAHAAQKKAAPSLLSKLLASEIRRERSHLLQAFRFLSQNGRSELSAASGANCAGVPRGRRPRDDVVMRTSSSRVVVAKMAGQLLTRVPRGGASRVCAQWESFIAHTACPSAADAQRFCYPRVARPRLTRVHAAGGGAKSILTGGYAVFLTMRFKRPHLRAGRHAMCASRARRPCVGRARREFGRRGKQAMHLHRRCEMRTHEAASASRCGLALRTQPLLRL